MRILIDTNVLISLEDDREIEEVFAKLVRLSSGKHELLVHPEATADIERDRDRWRAAVTLTKFSKYGSLEKPPVPDSSFLHRLAPTGSPNDVVDAHLLFAVRMNAVDFLVSNDFQLIRRALAIGVEDRVYLPSEAARFLQSIERPEPKRHTAVERVPAHDLDPKDPFFDSFRGDYPGFDEWLARTSRSGRRSYVLKENGMIKAVMIYKDELAPNLPGVPGNVLKIATLKVSDEARGQKVGELFLKLAMKMAFSRGLRGVYVTVYPKHEALISLLEEFGFEKVGEKPDDRGGLESVYLKSLEPPRGSQPVDPVLAVRKWYPHFVDGSRVRKFLVPIQPRFHDRLFPEVRGHQMRIPDFSGVMAEGNTIKKAYLSRSSVGSVVPGSLLLFYRSKDSRAMTSVGVVEHVGRSTTAEEVLAQVGKRSVYSAHEVRQICDQGEVLILLFWHVSDIPHPPSYEAMLRLGLLKGPPQSIQEFSHANYTVLKEVCEIDKRAALD